MKKPIEQLMINIRILRKKYNESQEDLGLIIDESKQAISNYEKGLRTPDARTIKKIAKHYNVSEDVLLNSKLINQNEFFSNLTKNIDDVKYRIDSNNVTCPIISSKRSLENESFKKAYHLHHQIIRDREKGIYNDTLLPEFNQCIDYYSEAINAGVYESLANILGLMISAEIAANNPDLLHGALLLNQNKIDVRTFVKEYCLYDEYNDHKDEYTDENIMTDADKQELKDQILQLMKALRQKPKFYDLISYYAALRYIFNAIETDYSSATNNIIGFEMMISELQLGNPYAIDFLIFFS